MNTTDISPLPPHAHLEDYKKQANDLLNLGKSLDAEAFRRVKKYHPHPSRFPEADSLPDAFALSDAQQVIASEYGFESWPRFLNHVEGLADGSSPTFKFECACDAIINGERQELQELLTQHPDLVRARSGRMHRATLLHYLGANGFENYRQKSSAHAVEIARLLLNSGAEVDAIADIYGGSTTLGLVATSIHPKRAGVQIALLELLLRHGAAVDGISGSRSVLVSALHNGRLEAAEFLARQGALLDLEAAAGVGRLDIVKSFYNEHGRLREIAMAAQQESGFIWACEYGRNDVIDFLLDKGVDLDARANTGMTGLHWAVVGGQVKTIQLLLERGASLEARNVYGGTALDQALWCSANDTRDVDYVPIIEMLDPLGAAE